MAIEHRQVLLVPNNGEPAHWMAAVSDLASYQEPDKHRWPQVLAELGKVY